MFELYLKKYDQLIKKQICFVLLFLFLGCGRSEDASGSEDIGVSIDDIKNSSNWTFNKNSGLADGSSTDSKCNHWIFNHVRSWNVSKIGSFQIKIDGQVVDTSLSSSILNCSEYGSTLMLIFIDKNSNQTILSTVQKTFRKFEPVTIQYIWQYGYTWDSSLDCKMYGKIERKVENKTFNVRGDFEDILKKSTCKMEKVTDTKFNCDFGNAGCSIENSACLINRGLTIRCSNYGQPL